MKNLKLRGKLIFVNSILIFIAVLILSTVSYLSLGFAYDRVIAATREKLDQMIQSEVECMIGVLEANYARYENGEITEKEAKENAAYLVRTTRYNNGVGYFWADMADGLSAVHINPDVEGTNRYNTQDAMGNYFVQDTIAAGDKPNGGFIDFYFAKPGESEPKAKRGFVKKFDPYGWYIGTGNYEEDMLPFIQTELDASKHAQGTALLVLYTVGVLVLVAGIFVMMLIAKKISKPIEQVSQRLKLLSQGNLQDRVETTQGKDEVGVLTRSLSETVEVMRTYIENISYVLSELDQGNMQLDITLEYIGDFAPIKKSLVNTVETFNKTFLTINNSADEVASNAEQVSSSAQALAQGATEQASSVEELASAINEISGQVKRNAQNLQLAKDMVSKVGNEVLDSNHQMQEMTRAINEISEASSEIGKIIKTIEDIAFQTNILALNAAVEAARAGVSGKGFAVVADEVRNLASKSSEASKNTSALIEKTLRSVNNGTEIAEKTADSLLSVVDGTKEITEQINEIAKESKEQANSIGQVTLGIDQISAVVQTNSATAEESAAASEELSAQAQNMKALVGRFRVKANTFYK